MNTKYNPFQFPPLALASMVAIVAIVAMTLGAELSGGFKGALTDLAGHHWISKGLLSLGIFLIVWLASALGLKEEPRKVKAWTLAVVIVSLLGMGVIFLFYLSHFLTA